jgi:hypothetical protein
VNYSGARLPNPKVKSSELYGPGAPDTVRWHTRQSGALGQGTLEFLCSFLFELFLLVCVEPLCTCRIYNLK